MMAFLLVKNETVGFNLHFLPYFCFMGNKSVIAMFGMSGLLVLFAGYASILPDVLESNAQVEISTSKNKLKHYLSSAENFQDWMFSDGVKRDEWRILLSGKKTGEGSVLKWFSESIGDGGLEVKMVSDSHIVFERISDNNLFRDRGYLFFDAIDSNHVNLRLIDSLDVSTNFAARYEAQDEDYIEKIDASNLVVLKRLKQKIETE